MRNANIQTMGENFPLKQSIFTEKSIVKYDRPAIRFRYVCRMRLVRNKRMRGRVQRKHAKSAAKEFQMWSLII